MKIQYEITIKGKLPADWNEWFDVFGSSYENNETRFNIIAHDQASLLGILNRLQTLNIKLVSVNPINEITF